MNQQSESKITAKEVAEGMNKKANWQVIKVDAPKGIVIGDSDGWLIADTLMRPHITDEGDYMNAEAIVRAVNSTWLKSLNPAAMEILLSLAKNRLTALQEMSMTTSEQDSEAEQLRNAISFAEIK